MLKQLFILISLSVTGSYVVADQTPNGQPSTQAAPQPTPAKRLNNPAVGGRQAGSEQIFGTPTVSPSNSPRAPKRSDYEPNNPTVGGRQASSEQIFGQSATPTGKPQKYTNPNVVRGDSNSPTVGGRQAGSEQLFGQSAQPVTSATPSK